MKITRSRIFSAIMVYILIAIILTQNVYAHSSTGDSLSWYCIRARDNLRPPLPSEFSIINDYGGYYIGADSEEKTVYLTFDAGYENGNVKKTLDILNDNDVKGAFFILSNLINSSPELVKEMAHSGHLVCNHTARHKDMSRVTCFEDFSRELNELENVYTEATGMELSKFFRPPEGRFNENTLRFAQEMGYKTVFWSFAYADWDNKKQMSPEVATKKILDNIHNGAVILLHPTSDTNVKILDPIIKELKRLGYNFGTLDELTC